MRPALLPAAKTFPAQPADNSRKTKGLFQVLASRVRTSTILEDAFVAGLEWAEGEGLDFWNQLACLEVIGRD